MARGSNAVAAVVAALVLLFVTVIRTTHLGEARGGSVDVDHAAVLDVLNRMRGELAAVHNGIDNLDRKLTGLVAAGQLAGPDHRLAVPVPPAHPADDHGGASLGRRSGVASSAGALGAPETNFLGCGFRPKQRIRRYMIDSWGGSRSQFLQEYLQKTTMKHGEKAMVDHIHDRFPPAFMAYPRAEKFTKKAMTGSDRASTMLILLTRKPSKSLSSRMYMAHCLNMQGDPATCRAMSGLTRLEILNNYVTAGKDMLHIQDHWDAYKHMPVDVEVYHLDSDDLFIPERFAVIRMHLGLPDDAEPPRFLSNGDHDHFEKPQKVIDGLDRIYGDLTKDMKAERDAFWASC